MASLSVAVRVRLAGQVAAVVAALDRQELAERLVRYPRCTQVAGVQRGGELRERGDDGVVRRPKKGRTARAVAGRLLAMVLAMVLGAGGCCGCRAPLLSVTISRRIRGVRSGSQL